MLGYHGYGSPGGVAHAFKVLERALPLLGAGSGVERREIIVETAFAGPGARDAFELVTRAVTENRFILDLSLAQPEHGPARERFAFRLRYRDRVVELTLREGFVSDEFIALTRQDSVNADEARRLVSMKEEMAARVMSVPAAEVYDVRVRPGPDGPR